MSAEANQYVLCTSEYDPERCLATNAGTSPCRYKAVAPSKFCPAHGGVVNQTLTKRAELANYRLTEYRERVGDLASSNEIKSLREEIGITRLLAENLINQCKNPNLLLMHTDKISMLMGQIGNLIEKAQKIEERNSNLLDRKVVLVIADEIITVIKLYVTDPDALLEIGTRIVSTIDAIGSIPTVLKA